MKIIYNKLIRDGIPEIIAESGKTCEVKELSPDAFLQALSAKLVEEAREVQEAVKQGGREEMVKELADLNEVVETLCDLLGIDPKQVSETQQQRRKTRGGFTRRLWLEWVEDDS